MRIVSNLEISIQIIEKLVCGTCLASGHCECANSAPEPRFYVQVFDSDSMNLIYENDRPTHKSAIAILGAWLSDTLRSQGGL